MGSRERRIQEKLVGVNYSEISETCNAGNSDSNGTLALKKQYCEGFKKGK